MTVCALAWLALLAHHSYATSEPEQGASACGRCVSIQIEAPVLVRGPTSALADSLFTELALGSGRFRGFSANGATFAIDGQSPADMSGAATPVLRPGGPGEIDSCGQWLDHVENLGDRVIGFVHDERLCDYEIGQTDKSMSLSMSFDKGLTWSSIGTFVSSSQKSEKGKMTGEGDCSVVERDRYYYAYCLRAKDWTTFVVRAPVENPTPSHWMKFYNGRWSEPGRDGDASALHLVGADGRTVGGAAAYLGSIGRTILLGQDSHGLRLFTSADGVSFDTFETPILPLDGSAWKRPAPTPLVAYPSLIDGASGRSELGDTAYLVYTYVPPNEGIDAKYLVFRRVVFGPPREGEAAVVLMVPVYKDKAALHVVSSMQPFDNRTLNDQVSYLTASMLTTGSVGKASVRVKECIGSGENKDDHLFVTEEQCPDRYSDYGTAGWLSAQARPGFEPVLQCVNQSGRGHYLSTKRDCDGVGRLDRGLGYGPTSGR